jgi:hypothetical protein
VHYQCMWLREVLCFKMFRFLHCTLCLKIHNVLSYCHLRPDILHIPHFGIGMWDFVKGCRSSA